MADMKTASVPKPEEKFDLSTKEFRRIYELDNERLCFLSFFLTDQRELVSISFDVEDAEDYHYQIGVDKLPALSAALGCGNTETELVKAFTKLLRSVKGPFEIGDIIRNAGVQFDIYSFPDYSYIETSRTVADAPATPRSTNQLRTAKAMSRKRQLFLLFTTFSGGFVLTGIVVDILVYIIFFTPVFVFFLCLFLREGKKDKNKLKKKPQADPPVQASPTSQLPELIFAIDLLSETKFELLKIREFAYFRADMGLYIDHKTMTEFDKRFLVAFTDLEQSQKGPNTSHHRMTPEEYVPIICDMPFDGIVINPFDESRRKIIEKSIINKERHSQRVQSLLSEKSNDEISVARGVITAIQEKYKDEAAAVENDANRITDEELLSIFIEYFTPNKNFYSQQGSAKYIAYFDTINAATLEMLNNPSLYRLATKREPEELQAMCSNRIPLLTNQLICGLIFCTGKFAVIPSTLLCIDFAESIPNCIAIYLLLTAQKLPPNERKKLIDAGDGANTKPLSEAMNTLSVCDPNWEYKVAGK